MTTLRKLCTDTRPLSHHSSTEAHVKANESGSRLTLEEGEYSACLGGHPALSRPHREVLAAFLGLSRVPGDPELVAGKAGAGYLVTPADTTQPSHHVAPEDVLGVITAIDGLASVEPKAFAGKPKVLRPFARMCFPEDSKDNESTIDLYPSADEGMSMAVTSVEMAVSIHLPPGDVLKMAYHQMALLKAQGYSLNEADYDDNGQPLTQPK